MTSYGAVRFMAAGATRAIWRVRVRGTDRLPREGSYVLAPSHRSMMDIPLLATVTTRRIRFMGKAQAFAVPVIGRLFRAVGSFPVARDGSDRGPLRLALRLLDEGDPLAVYPEGTRQHGREIAELQEGAAYLALRAGVPIVPVGIAGSEEIVRSRPHRWLPGLRRAVVVVGVPIVPPPREGAVRREVVRELTATLRKEMQQVLDEAFAERDGLALRRSR